MLKAKVAHVLYGGDPPHRVSQVRYLCACGTKLWTVADLPVACPQCGARVIVRSDPEGRVRLEAW